MLELKINNNPATNYEISFLKKFNVTLVRFETMMGEGKSIDNYLLCGNKVGFLKNLLQVKRSLLI